MDRASCCVVQNPTAMSFTALHVIEQQLVMQHCDLRTLVSLARCNRSLLAAASNHFTFCFVLPVVVHARPNLGGLVSSSLLRFCGISLRSSELEMSVEIYSCMLDAIQFVPHLREVHCPFWIVDSDWCSLLMSNNMQGVTT